VDERIHGQPAARRDDEAALGVGDELVDVVKLPAGVDHPRGDLVPHGHDDDAVEGLTGLGVDDLAAPGAGGLGRAGEAPEADAGQEQQDDERPRCFRRGHFPRAHGAGALQETEDRVGGRARAVGAHGRCSSRVVPSRSWIVGRLTAAPP
jgi:hypothetical protein